jgi:hypothetical protein
MESKEVSVALLSRAAKLEEKLKNDGGAGSEAEDEELQPNSHGCIPVCFFKF